MSTEPSWEDRRKAAEDLGKKLIPGYPGYFKARNGLQVRQAENGGVEVGKPGFLDYTTPAVSFALEEFFQDLRDRTLGRWRDRVNPHLVVYPKDGGVLVVDERNGNYQFYTVADANLGTTTAFASAARGYFSAHPVRKPWEAAEPGEAWLLTIDGVEVPAVVDASYDFTTASQTLAFGSDDMDVVEDARRIFPAVKP